MVEVKAIDAGLRLQAGALEAALDGASVAGLEFYVGEPLDGRRHAEVLGRRLSEGRFDLAAHRIQMQLLQFLLEGSHCGPFRLRE
jgi:hypothetical protein